MAKRGGVKRSRDRVVSGVSHAGRITLSGVEVKSDGRFRPPLGTAAQKKLVALGDVSARRVQFERDVRKAVGVARRAGLSWAVIAPYLGTGEEAARQRYGSTKRVPRVESASPSPEAERAL